MTQIHVAPDDNVQDIIDTQGGPGVEIVFAPGSYRLNLRLYGNVPAHNGAPGNPMILRSAEEHKATLNAARSDDDPIHGLSTRHVVVDGFKVNGPSDATRQCVHFHGEVKKGTRPEDITIQNCRLLRRGGDAIKLSEVDGAVIAACEIDGQYAASSVSESGIDANKCNNVTVRDTDIFDHHMGMVFKGGGVGLTFERNTVRARKGLEVGGHGGTGPAEGFDGNWAAKSAVLQDNTMVSTDSSQYALRFIGAHDCVAEGNALTGDIVYSDSRQKDGPDHVCSNIVVDGETVVEAWVPVVEEQPAPTPAPAPIADEDPVAPPPVQDSVTDPDTFVFSLGDGGKQTIKPFEKGTSVIELRGFDLSWAALQDYVTNKSDSVVIIDLRKVDGPRLTLRGKDVRPLAEADMRLV